ncbi:MAG: leucyl aminopeptidase [Bacillota bacterium]|nr:leucyl aminopeptidase [Bacillota bacterium]
MNKKFYDWKWDEIDSLVYLVAKDADVCSCVSKELEALKDRKLFEGKSGEMATTVLVRDGKYYDLVFVGGAEKMDEKLFGALAKAYRYLKGRKAVNIGFNFENVSSGFKKLSRELGEIFTLADYRFDEYKSDAKPSTVKNLYFKGFEADEKAFEEGVVLGESNVFARMLVDMPANVLTPGKLASLAKEECEKYGIDVAIKDKDDIESLGMKAFLAVAQASSNEPRLIIMRYRGNPDSKETIGYVGKGLTYDSGGLSIKPTEGMLTMKCDMGGAGAVIGAIVGIARLGLKVNVTAVVAACENMISGNSYKPGDIIGSMGGKTIFIANTDAEGRLTLVDAVTYILQEEKVTKLVDVATLTGAAIRALGSSVTATVTNNDAFYKNVKKSFDKAFEKIWRMPVFDEYKEALKHENADLTNSAAPGMQAAGLFIGEFVGETPWVHLDIAGPAFAGKAGAYFEKGATGAAVRPLIYLAKRERDQE